MRAAKVIGWSVVVLLALITVLVVVLLSLELSTYRGPLQSEITKAVGRQVSLRGEMSLQLSLHPTIAIEDVRLANPPWASRPDFARVGRVEIQLALWPLLHGNLDILNVGVDGLDVLFEARADGTNNWTFGQDTGTPPALPAIQSLSCEQCVIAYRVDADREQRLVIAAAAGALALDEPAQFLLSGSYRDIPFTLSLLGGTLTDLIVSSQPWPLEVKLRTAGATLEVKGDVDQADANLHFAVSGEQFGELVRLTGGTLPALGPYGLSGRLVKKDENYKVTNLAGHLGDKESANRFAIDTGAVAVAADEPIHLSLEGKVGERPFGITATGGTPAGLIAPVKPWPIELSATGAGARLQIKGTIAEPLKARGPDLRLSIRGKQFKELEAIAGTTLPALGSYRLSGRVRERNKGYVLTNFEGHIGDRGIPERVDITRAAIALPEDKPISLSVDGLYRKQRISVSFRGGTLTKLLDNKPWPVTVSARAADMNVSVKGTIAQPLEGKGVDLKVNADGVRLALIGVLVGTELPPLQPFRLSARVVESVDGYTVRDLKVQNPESDIAGTIAVQLDQSRLRVSAKLRSSILNLKPLVATVKKKPAKGDKADLLDISLPVADLRRIDADLELSLGRVTGGPVEIRDLTARVRLDNGNLTLEPLQVVLAGLSIQGRISLDARKEVPSVELELSSRDVDVAKTLGAFTKIDGFVSKAEGLSFTFKGAGQTVRALLTQGDINAFASGVDLAFRRNGAEEPVELHIASIEATARHGGAMQIAADAVYREVPINLVLRGESLTRLIEDRKSWPLALSARTDNTSLALKGSLTWPIDTQNFRLALTLNGERIDQLDPLLKTRLPPYGPYAISGQLERKNNAFSLSQLDVQIGLSHLEGKLAWSTAGPRPEITAKLKFNPLHLERLIEGLMREYGSADEKPKRDLVLPEFSIPVDTLRSIDLDLDLRATDVLGAQTHLGDVKVKLFLNDGRLAISPFEARLSGGEISIDLQLDARKETPTAAFLLKVKHLDYGMLLKELGATKVLEARSADFDVKLVGSGATLHSLLGSANGKIVFVSGPANFASADPLRLASLSSIIMTTATSSKDNTQLNCMIWPFEITGGVARSEYILIDMPRFTIGGRGTIDLATDKLKMVFRPRPKSPKLGSFAIPVEVKGSLMAPKVDTTKMRRRLALQIFVPLLWIKPGTGVENPCVEAIAKWDPVTGKPTEKK